MRNKYKLPAGSLSLICFFMLYFLFPSLSAALSPEEVVVVANKKANDSVSLARYYQQKRKIPEENLLIIRTTWKETCSREEYSRNIAPSIRKGIKKLGKDKKIRAIVTVYGIPLRIQPQKLTYEQEIKLKALKKKLESPPNMSAAKSSLQQIRKMEEEIKRIKQVNTRASVDSELALVLADPYPLQGWLPNPFFLGFQRSYTLLSKEQVILVSRLDGPDPATVRRIIDDALQVEQKGLTGTVYLDARWHAPKTKKKLTGYALYDAAIHNAASRLRAKTTLPVVVDDRPELFPEHNCPDAALYCGWYSLLKYRDCFTWNKGAVGYHIASGECTTLKREGSQAWCKRMLEKGVTATLGPVYEPYVQAFPYPDIFFPKLVEGYLTLGEVYLISLPYLSWQMVLVGDPLYTPFHPSQ